MSRDAARYMYEQSLFVRMQMNHPEDIHLLSIQYRMHPDISKFPSEQFYDSELQDGPDMEKLRRRIWHQSTLFGPYRFFDIQGKESSASGHSLVNHQEVTAAIALFRRVTADFREQEFSGMIGIITPYKQQLWELKRRFQSEFSPRILETIEFNTTDAFQGREREIIIFSCVRASPSGGVGFLSDIRRMNVGLTRAKSSLFVLGNAQSLLRNEFWGKLVRDARTRGVYTDGNILAMLNKSTRITDPTKRNVILPVAMDVDYVEPKNEKQEPTPDPRIKPGASNKDLPRKRPGIVDPKPESRKQQATGQGSIPHPKHPTIPLGRPSPAPIVAPASLLPPRSSEPESANVDTSKLPLCYRCGSHGHVKATCTNPPNPAKVGHMKRYMLGDPHDRLIPHVQSSLHPSHKRGPHDDGIQSPKRREMDGKVPGSRNLPPPRRTNSVGNQGNPQSPGGYNDQDGNASGGPPPPLPSLQRTPTVKVAPPRPKKAADPFIRKKEKRPRPPPPST